MAVKTQIEIECINLQYIYTHELVKRFRRWQFLSIHFNYHFPRWTWVSQYQNVSILHLLELRVMEVVLTTGALRRAKLQSKCHHQQTNTQFFYSPDALCVAQPRVQSTEWKTGVGAISNYQKTSEGLF